MIIRVSYLGLCGAQVFTDVQREVLQPAEETHRNCLWLWKGFHFVYLQAQNISFLLLNGCFDVEKKKT